MSAGDKIRTGGKWLTWVCAVLLGSFIGNILSHGLFSPAFDMRVATVAEHLCRANEGPRTVRKTLSGFDIRCRNGALFDNIAITLEDAPSQP